MIWSVVRAVLLGLVLALATDRLPVQVGNFTGWLLGIKDEVPAAGLRLRRAAIDTEVTQVID